MREILFRGKRLDNGEWVYGNFCMDAREQICGLCGVDGFIRRYNTDTKRMEMYEVDRETVGQYTGMVGKNGKRIFEDDVVRLYPGEEYEKTARVIMSKGCWILEFKDYWDFLDTNLHHLEVIGNIHDNPELLEEA